MSDLIYGGDPDLIHIPDGRRGDAGRYMASILDAIMRTGAEDRTPQQRREQELCPGCYMIVGFNMLLTLADRNGQSRRELCNSMIDAFTRLGEGEGTEEICVILDKEEEHD